MAQHSSGGPGVRHRVGVKLPGLKRYRVGGIHCVYHREAGKRMPANLPEHHPDFRAASNAAETGLREKTPEPVVRKDCVEDVAKRYPESHAFAAPSTSYQDVRRRDIDWLRRQGDGAVARLPFMVIRDITSWRRWKRWKRTGEQAPEKLAGPV